MLKSDNMTLFNVEDNMTGFELKLWRRCMNWNQERAAKELGVSVRSYQHYKKAKKNR